MPTLAHLQRHCKSDLQCTQAVAKGKCRSGTHHAKTTGSCCRSCALLSTKAIARHLGGGGLIPLDCKVCRRKKGFHRPHTSLRRCRSKVTQCTRNSIHINTLRSMPEHKQVPECQAVSNDASSTVSEQPLQAMSPCKLCPRLRTVSASAETVDCHLD